MRLRRKSLRRWSQRKRTDSSQQKGPLVLHKKQHLNRSLRLEHSTVFLPYSRDVTHKQMFCFSLVGELAAS